jgi:hypothetical protein
MANPNSKRKARKQESTGVAKGRVKDLPAKDVRKIKGGASAAGQHIPTGTITTR